jgi:hypothetical protein
MLPLASQAVELAYFQLISKHHQSIIFKISTIFKVATLKYIRFVRGEDIREVQKSITHLEWNYFDSNRLCAAYER